MLVHDSICLGSHPGLSSPLTLNPEFRRVRRTSLPLASRTCTAQYFEIPSRGGIKHPEPASRRLRAFGSDVSVGITWVSPKFISSTDESIADVKADVKWMLYRNTGVGNCIVLKEIGRSYNWQYISLWS